MMKKIISCLIALGLLAACSLDENPRDQIEEEAAYTSADALYRNTVATLYNYIGGSADGQGLQGTCRGIYDLQTFGSDEAMVPIRGTDWYDGGIWQQLYCHSWTPGHEMIGNSWLYLYKVITLCNRSLEQLEAHKQLLNEADLTEYKSEVRALRAIFYWYLLDLFGRVPIITSTDVEINKLKQSERSQVFEFVVNELLESRNHLAITKSAAQGEYYGRVTYPVATFALAKLMLNAEVYADDDWTDDHRPDGSKMKFRVDAATVNAWEAVIHLCDQLQGIGYTLEDSYHNNFVVQNHFSKENIWTIVMDRDLYYNEMQYIYRSLHYRHGAAYGISGENGPCATIATLKTFGYGTDDEDIRFMFNYWAEDVYDPYGLSIADRTGQPLAYKPWEVKLDLSGSPYVETAGARMKKYVIDTNALKGGKLMDNDIVLFRFADALLMRAEAKLRNGMDGQADYDAVRGRVSMPLRKISLQNLLDERLLELCWEGWRRQDLIRFGQYESLFEGDFWDDKVDESDGHTTVFPIPGSIITLNPNIVQNKGY